MTTTTEETKTHTEPRWKQQADEDLRKIRRFTNPIAEMVERDANEGDTRLVVTDMLTEVLGFDKYSDLTTEYQTRGEFADYGVRIEGQLVALIEVKRAAQKLNPRHLRQVESYGLKEGVDWLILTNGMIWQVYHLSGANNGEPVKLSKAIEFSLDQPITKTVLRDIAALHKQHWKRGALDAMWRRVSALSEESLREILMSERVVNAFRLEIKSVTGHNSTNEDISESLRRLVAGA